MKREDLRQGLQGSHKYGSVDEWRMLAVEDFKEQSRNVDPSGEVNSRNRESIHAAEASKNPKQKIMNKRICGGENILYSPRKTEIFVVRIPAG